MNMNRICNKTSLARGEKEAAPRRPDFPLLISPSFGLQIRSSDLKQKKDNNAPHKPGVTFPRTKSDCAEVVGGGVMQLII